MEQRPLPFGTDEFRAAWGEFEQMRREMRKKLTPTSTRRLFVKLLRMGERDAIRALNRSVENGWQGVFDPPAERGSGALASEAAAEGEKFKRFMERQ